MRDRVLLTGAGGFIGARLLRVLLQEGHDVHICLRPQTDRRRLAGLETQTTVHPVDLLDSAAVRRAFAAARPDVVYHLAAHVGRPEPCRRVEVLAGNVIGTANLLDAAGAEGFRVLIHTGTGAEYGPHREAIPETAAVDPRTDYAVAKAAATLLCLADGQRGRPVVVVRLFAVYGPGEAPYRLVPYVMDCCLGGVAPRVAAGQQWRDFIHVDDVVALLRRAAELAPTPGLVLHAAGGRAHRVRDMVETILAVAGNPVRAVYTPDAGPPDEPPPYLASVARTRSLTGWAPRHGLREGVAQTWAWHRSHATRRAA